MGHNLRKKGPWRGTKGSPQITIFNQKNSTNVSKVVPKNLFAYKSKQEKKINIQKQNRHIQGTKEFIEGRSIVTTKVEELQEMVNRLSGTGRVIDDHGEVVDFQKTIGIFINEELEVRAETPYGKIVYSKTGVHIIPANPNQRSIKK